MSDGSRISTFPLPPMQYVSCYTDERVQSGTVPPPPRPLDSSYSMFGVPCAKEDAVIHSLESQNIRRLYPALYDHKRELKKLNFSILANYLDLMDIVVKCPDSPDRLQKLEHMKLLFINMHHLINEYRPLQARDTLIEMLALQSSVTSQTVEMASRYLARADAIVGKATVGHYNDDDDEDEGRGGGDARLSQALLSDIDRLSTELSQLATAAAQQDDYEEKADLDFLVDIGDENDGVSDELQHDDNDENYYAASAAAAGDIEDIELEADSDETENDDEEDKKGQEGQLGDDSEPGINDESAEGSAAATAAAETMDASQPDAADLESGDGLPCSVLDDLDSLLGPGGFD